MSFRKVDSVHRELSNKYRLCVNCEKCSEGSTAFNAVEKEIILSLLSALFELYKFAVSVAIN